MKILFCPTHYVFDDGERGSELSWAFQIANGIAQQNIGSIIVSQFANVKKKYPYTIVELQKEKKQIDLGLVNTLQFNFLYTKYGSQLLRKEGFDLLHHVLPFGLDRTFNFLFLSPRYKKLPKVIGPIQSPLPFYADNVHDVKASAKSTISLSLQKSMISILQPLLSMLSRRTVKNADAVIVINETTKALLMQRGIAAKKIIIIPPGVDTKRFIPIKKTKSEEKRIEVLSVGALIERKGYDMLLRGLSEVVKTHTNIRLTIVGEGPQKKNLQALVKKLSLEKYVIFERYVTHIDMPKMYQKADIFVSMSKAEGFATVCLEAMASGLAVISTKVGGFIDVIQDGENGFLIQDGNYHMLAEKLSLLITNKHMRDSISTQARKDAEDKYDWHKCIIPAYWKVYRKLLA